jgi:PD-(D/E)XK nuclease superfamily
MDTNEDKLLLKQEVFQIVGSAIEVLNTLGNGLIGKPYENALVVEFGLRKIPFRAAPKAFGVVVDTKVIDRITDHERGLMLNYLRIANLRVGVVLNFKRAKLEWERTVL